MLFERSSLSRWKFFADSIKNETPRRRREEEEEEERGELQSKASSPFKENLKLLWCFMPGKLNGIKLLFPHWLNLIRTSVSKTTGQKQLLDSF